jgi:dienelactone hydrolase
MKNQILLMWLISLLAPAAQAKIISKDIEYTFRKTTYSGRLFFDEKTKTKKPGVLIVHGWMGPGGFEFFRAGLLAESGYVVFVADMFGKGRRPQTADEARNFAGDSVNDRGTLRSVAKLALDTLAQQPTVDKKKLAAIGFSYGGLVALELARSGAPLKGVVTFHGALDSKDPHDAKNITGKVLVLLGADDPFVPEAEIVKAFEREMRGGGVDWQEVMYGNTMHGFTDQGVEALKIPGAAFNAEADRRSWIAMNNFLSEIFSP